MPSTQKIAKYLGAGVLNTLFGYAVYVVLIFVGLQYLVALLVATVIGVIFNYFSFRGMVFQTNGGRTVFVKFVLAYAVIYFVNAALLEMLVDHFRVGPYVAQIVCIPFGVIASWVANSNWVFNKNGQSDEENN